MPSISTFVVHAALLSLLTGRVSAYFNTQSPLSCTDLTATTCSYKGLTQCCIAGGDCCGDGSCCGVGQQCLASGSAYLCCTSSSDCPSASASSTVPASSGFHAQIPCSPVDGDSWYCDYGQSCGFAQGSCIGVPAGGGGGGGDSSSLDSSTSLDSSQTPLASPSDGAAATTTAQAAIVTSAGATQSSNDGTRLRYTKTLDGKIGLDLLVALAGLLLAG